MVAIGRYPLVLTDSLCDGLFHDDSRDRYRARADALAEYHHVRYYAIFFELEAPESLSQSAQASLHLITDDYTSLGSDSLSCLLDIALFHGVYASVALQRFKYECAEASRLVSLD